MTHMAGCWERRQATWSCIALEIDSRLANTAASAKVLAMDSGGKPLIISVIYPKIVKAIRAMHVKRLGREQENRQGD